VVSLNLNRDQRHENAYLSVWSFLILQILKLDHRLLRDPVVLGLLVTVLVERPHLARLVCVLEGAWNSTPWKLIFFLHPPVFLSVQRPILFNFFLRFQFFAVKLACLLHMLTRPVLDRFHDSGRQSWATIV